MTQILPFIMFGIGLDDAFIIFGEYIRTDPKKNPAQRIYDTFEEVGLSIFLTSLTTSVAFGLGCMAKLPMVRWLSFYAFTTVIIDFIYQISFFVALIVIDERRIERQKRLRGEGCTGCLCKAAATGNPREDTQEEDTQGQTKPGEGRFTAANDDSAVAEDGKRIDNNRDYDDDSAENPMKPGCGDQEQPQHSPEQLNDLTHHRHVHLPGPPSSTIDRLMRQYANVLMRKPVKIFVIVAFVSFTLLGIYSATKFTQEFNMYDMLPRGSYVTDYYKGLEKFADRGFVVPQAYFRGVNQSDPEIQRQMEDFVNQLVRMDSFSSQPPYFWSRHFQEFLTYDDRLLDLTFNQQINIFLSIDAFRLLYGDHIVRDPDSGDITASRCVMHMDNIDVQSIKSQIQAFKDQKEISEDQPINSDGFNKNGEGFKFFLFEEYMFYGWDFYGIMVNELITGTIFTVIAVCTVTFMFLPHWTATLFLTPIICICYIDLIGTSSCFSDFFSPFSPLTLDSDIYTGFIQWFGVHLDPMSYFTLIMSIGLLVDFNMHILFRYYESPCATREGKVKDTLQTMGSSVVTGGISTFLGVLPLIAASSTLMTTLFYGFWGMVIVGCSHGAILLPVILSFIGPLRTTPGTLDQTSIDDGPLGTSAKDEANRFNDMPGSAGSTCCSLGNTTSLTLDSGGQSEDTGSGSDDGKRQLIISTADVDAVRGDEAHSDEPNRARAISTLTVPSACMDDNVESSDPDL
jgi:predicted RND superfamily exporter protein